VADKKTKARAGIAIALSIVIKLITLPFGFGLLRDAAARFYWE
jgi:hypothetical protein